MEYNRLGQRILAGVCSVWLIWGASGWCGEGIAVEAIKGVYAGPSADKVDGQACKTIADGMKTLYGVQLAVLKELPKDDGAILVGKQAALNAGMITEAELQSVSPGGFCIKTQGNRVAIAGSNAYATLQGAGEFLKRLEGGTPPKGKTIPEINAASKPVFAYRPYHSRPEWAEADKALAALHPELNGKTDLWIDHSAGLLLPKDIYYDAHPEYYAMLADGKRVAKASFTYHRTPLCLSNPDLTRISIERALQWVGLQPEKTYFPITYGDTGVWCQCETCRKLDPAPGEYATRLLTWVNAVARAVGQKHPDKVIITFAYGGTDKAPPTIKPEKNVWVCLSTSLGGVAFLDHMLAKTPKKLDAMAAKIDGWLAIAPEQVTVCEYLGGVYEPCTADKLAARCRYYARKGIRGILFTFGHPENFNPFWDYLVGRLMWDPEQDAEALAAAFAKQHYGPAADSMADYLRCVHAQYADTLKKQDELRDGYPKSFYTKEFTEKALAAFAKARESAKDNAKLLGEIRAETQMFIMDWMRHPLSTDFTDEAKEALKAQLASLLDLVDASPAARTAFGRSVHQLGVQMESAQKGALKVVEEWLAKQNLPRPAAEKLANGVRLRPEVFMYAGFGPEVYKGGHVKDPCPPKTAVAIYVEGNSANRSHRMEAEFELDEVPGDGAATLDIEGQDCDHDVDTSVIRIELNGVKFFEGQVQVVKGNWSRQSFAIPAGALKKGPNKLEFRNAVDPKSIKKWHERWFMLSDAVIKFTP
jgi:hypothetical protein